MIVLLSCVVVENAVREAQDFMDTAVNYLGDVIHQFGIQCDYRGKLLTVAISQSEIKRLQYESSHLTV